jgi:hypothetical protein
MFLEVIAAYGCNAWAAMPAVTENRQRVLGETVCEV